MTRKKLTRQQIKQAILTSLSQDLLEPKYRALLTAQDAPERGHCAVATEAFYYLAGGRKAGFMPVVCGYDVDSNGKMHFGAASGKPSIRRETHWWLCGPAGGERGKGEIVDITAKQFLSPFPYQHGHNTGFMQPQQKPSKRAQIVMDRVMAKLGKAALGTFRRDHIEGFQKNAAGCAQNKKAGLRLRF